MSLPEKRRIAAIDIGTNSFHLIIVEVNKNGKLKLLDRERAFLRLGSQHGKDLGLISADEIVSAIKVLKSFLALANYHKADIRAVSTSAVREAKNKNEFIREVLGQTGIKVETIEGTEEANLIFLGMKNALPLDDKSVLGIDIGGGSTEFIYGVNGNPVFAESVKIGAVRLSKMFFPDFFITDSSVKECSEFVEKQIKANTKISTDIKLDFAVGSSGTVDTICLIKQFQKEADVKPRLNGYIFNKAEFDEIYSFVMNLKNPSERMQVPGIEVKRADIIPSGFIILKKIFELFRIEKMILSEFALREGVVYDIINKSKK
jgi:exopolyphosphatase/guanosine-5'-triphosphate,3'-diphosphate pyrophosphatase